LILAATPFRGSFYCVLILDVNNLLAVVPLAQEVSQSFA
jgi:hypothetical protein